MWNMTVFINMFYYVQIEKNYIPEFYWMKAVQYLVYRKDLMTLYNLIHSQHLEKLFNANLT